jgi:hypothetical protein
MAPPLASNVVTNVIFSEVTVTYVYVQLCVSHSERTIETQSARKQIMGQNIWTKVKKIYRKLEEWRLVGCYALWLL